MISDLLNPVQNCIFYLVCRGMSPLPTCLVQPLTAFDRVRLLTAARESLVAVSSVGVGGRLPCRARFRGLTEPDMPLTDACCVDAVVLDVEPLRLRLAEGICVDKVLSLPERSLNRVRLTCKSCI